MEVGIMSLSARGHPPHARPRRARPDSRSRHRKSKPTAPGWNAFPSTSNRWRPPDEPDVGVRVHDGVSAMVLRSRKVHGATRILTAIGDVAATNDPSTAAGDRKPRDRSLISGSSGHEVSCVRSMPFSPVLPGQHSTDGPDTGTPLRQSLTLASGPKRPPPCPTPWTAQYR